MKKLNVLLIVIFLITAGSSFSVASGQTKEDKQREAEIKQAIDEQKKAMETQRKEQDKAAEELRKQAQELEKLHELDVYIDDEGNTDDPVRIYRRGGNRGSYSFTVPSAPDAPRMPSFYYPTIVGGDAERTTWEFSKSIKENSFKREYTFDVEKSVKSVVMSVSGDCKAGDIRIKILTPGGKSYSDIVIDEFGNLNWRKSFNISEDENQDKAGEWKFQIASNNATGFFRISLQTY